MNALKLLPFCLLLCLLPGPASAEHKIGDQVVVIHDKSPITFHGKVLNEIDRGGIHLTVYAVNDDGLLISQNPAGWISKQHVTTLAKAVDVFTDQIRQNPQDSGAYAGRGMIWQGERTIDDGIRDLDEAIRLNPKNAEALVWRGFDWLLRDDLDKAISDLTEALQLNPKHAIAYSIRADCWNKTAEFEKAIADSSDAIRLQPKFVPGHENRAIARVAKKDFRQAIIDCNEALVLEPKSGGLYGVRGTAYSGIGRYARAAEDFEKAIALAPNDPDTCKAFAWFQATCSNEGYRNGQDAVEYATKAYHSLLWTNAGWRNAAFIDTIAAAYAEDGDFEKAVEQETKAIELASERQKEEFQARLDLFKSGKPYRETPKP